MAGEVQGGRVVSGNGLSSKLLCFHSRVGVLILPHMSGKSVFRYLWGFFYDIYIKQGCYLQRSLLIPNWLWEEQGTMVLRLPKGTSGLDDKEFVCNAGDLGLITGSGGSPGEGKDYSLQYSCLETPWTEQPGRLQSMGLQRVRQDWGTHSFTFQGNFAADRQAAP